MPVFSQSSGAFKSLELVVQTKRPAPNWTTAGLRKDRPFRNGSANASYPALCRLSPSASVRERSAKRRCPGLTHRAEHGCEVANIAASSNFPPRRERLRQAVSLDPASS